MKQRTLLFILMLLPVMASAYDAKIGGIYYNFNKTAKTAEVTHNESSNPYSDDVSIPNEVTYQGVKYSVTSIGNYAFSECEDLTSVIIPNSVTSIGENAFWDCNALTSVTIGNSVKSIGDGAFYFCWKLTSVTIPNSVITIGSGAFFECRGLTSITIGNGVQSIGEDAFAGCRSSVHISDLSAWCKINFLNALSNPLYFGQLFLNGSEVKSLVIPNDVTYIRNYAFSMCHSLTSVTIPNSVTKIGNYAFDHSGLTSLIIPNSVTSIGENAFSYCSLKTILIGESIKRIGYYAFGYCQQLTDVTCKATTVPTTDANTFQNSNFENAHLYVSEAVIDRYEAAVPWNSFMEISAIPSFTLSYIIDGTVYKTYILEEGDNIIPEPISIMKGYSFSGWSEIPSTMPAHDVAIHGNFVATDVLSCEDTECVTGSNPTLKLSLRNEDEVKLCQFDLKLPVGVTVVTKSNGKLDAKLTERAENHSVSSQRLSNGDYRFVVSSMDNDSFTGNEGTLMEIMLDVSATMEAGEYTVKVLNVELSVPDGNDLMVVRPADTESKLIVKDYTPGDVNNDGTVSVTDVGCAINYILEQVPSVFIFEAADMNGDKSVSVTDVGMIINLILSDGASIRQRTPERSSYDEGSLPGLFLQSTDEGYELLLEDKDAFIGFQFDVELGDGAIINGIRLNGSADSDHLMAYRRLGNGKWRVVCYSPTNSTFVQDHDALLTIITTGGITVSDIRLTTSGLNELRPADLSSMPTGIASIGQGMQVSVQGHTLHISSDCDTTLRLLTVGGNVYRILNVQQGVNSFDGLRAGVYMIENKKIIIR